MNVSKHLYKHTIIHPLVYSEEKDSHDCLQMLVLLAMEGIPQAPGEEETHNRDAASLEFPHPFCTASFNPSQKRGGGIVYEMDLYCKYSLLLFNINLAFVFL